MNAMPQSWDGYFINLDRSIERRAHMENQLSASGLDHYRRFSASDGKLIRTKSTRTPGEVGTYLSHLNLLRGAAKGDRPIHVLEDDVIVGDLAAAAVSAVIDNRVLEEFDLVFLETYIGRDVQHLRRWHGLLQEVRNRGWPIERGDQLRVIDMTSSYLFGTTSYLAQPSGIKRVVAVLDEEWQRGPTMPLDAAIQKAARARRLRIGCLFPFVTSLDFHLNSASEAGRTERTDDVLVQSLLRYSFYVGADIDGLARPLIRRLIAERFGAPDSMTELHADVLQYYLRRREGESAPPASPE
jgi:GR25 family glycosyltransferase involved in LPS biosynthesis